MTGKNERGAEDIEGLEVEVTELRDQIRRLEKRLTTKVNKLEKMQEERNQPFLGDIEWLINNPNQPGQFKAMRKWVTERYGHEFAGVHPCGYNTHTMQQAFQLVLTDEYGDKTETYFANARSFLTDHFHLLKADQSGLVHFQTAVGERSGIRYLCYRPADGTWMTLTERYGRIQDEIEYPDMDTALFAARKIVEAVED